MKKEFLNLTHKLLIENVFKEKNSLFSEYNFSNLFLFREVHKYEVVFLEGILAGIKGVSRVDHEYFIPFISLAKQDLELIFKEVKYVYPLEEKEITLFDTEIFKGVFLERDSDYLYLREHFVDFGERRDKTKRKEIEKLYQSHKIAIEPLTKENKAKAEEVLEKWEKQEGEEADFSSCTEALNLLEELGLEGDVVFVDGAAAAFFVGEPYCAEGYLMHFAKANLDYKGLYPLLYSLAAKKTDRKYLNLEQDLGLPNLKKSKQSFHPAFLLHKYRLQKGEEECCAF